MAAIPSTAISLPSEPFIGESLDLTLGFDNTGDVTGYGPFLLFYIDSTGADGDDGLTFNSASYLGSSVTTTEITLDNTGASTFNVFGVEQTVTHPTEFTAGDTLVVIELPFGSFVTDQPQADVSISLDGNINSDLDTAINLQTQGGFVFGETPTEETDGSDDPIYEDISGDSLDTVSPQLVSLTKRYLGPEDETATGPNFVRQFELVVDIADGQTITNLDITDILPDNMQFVDVVSIVDSTGSAIASGNITEIATPDDGGLTSIGSVNVTENDLGSDGIPTPGGTLTRQISSVTGTTGSEDLVLTYEFFIPRLDANSDVIIDADTGDDVISTNESQLGDNDGINDSDDNVWNPQDSRDSEVEVYVPPTATSPSDPTHDLEDQAIAIQKTVSNISSSENTPGDVLEYTLDFQISDYFAFQNIDIFDTFSDGQRFDTSFTPTLYVTEHGQQSLAANFDITNYIVDETQIGNDTNPATDGSTVVTFEISDELITRAFDDSDGILIGGGVPDGGFNDGGISLNNNPPLPNGATEGQIIFRTVIQQEYSDTFVSGDASVDIGDRLDNSAIIDGEVLDVDDLSTTGFSEDDDTTAAIAIESGNLYKSIYAINGEIFTGADTDNDLSDGLTGYANAVNVAPGDEITYRLTYELPTTDVEDLTFIDYFPLPIFDAETEFASTTFDPTVSTTAPSAGATKYGPLDTFSTRTDAGSNNPNLTFSVSNDGSNSLTYSYADFDDDDNQSSIVDILVTVTADDQPAADGLLFTNQVRQTNNNTFNENSFLDAIIQVTLDQPNVVDITKGVVAFSSDNTDIAFSSSFPSGVTFATGGGTSFTGVVSSTDLASTPLTSDLTGGLEAGDLVTFALVVENQGTSRKGAFDVTIQDDLPTGFKIPDAGLNLEVTDGTGATITYTELDDNDGSGDDLFGSGIELDDPGSTAASGSGITTDTDAGALDPYDADSGENLAIITFDLEVDEIAPYQDFDNTRDLEQITNTATLVSYANIEGGEDFTGSTDSATVDIELPEVIKSIVATSEAHTPEDASGVNNNNNATTGRRRLAIGEIIRFRLVTAIPEGTANNFQVQDRLPSGFVFLDDNTATAAFISDDAPITSVTTTTDYANPLAIGLGDFADFASISGDPNEALWVQGSTEATVTPTFILPDVNVGSNFDIGDDTTPVDPDIPDPDEYNAATDIYFKFGDLNNPDRDADQEYVVVEFNALLANNLEDNNGNIDVNNENNNRSNNFQVLIGTGNNFANSDTLARSNSINVKITEPAISLTKEVSDNNTTFSGDTVLADSGNTVYFSLSFNNNGSQNRRATAFEVQLTDTVPDGLTLVGIESIDWDNGDGSGGSGTSTGIVSGADIDVGDMVITPSFDTGTGAIAVDVDQMPSDGEITIIYSATVDNDVNPDEIITNTANIVYTSLPGTGTTSNPTGSDIPGTAGSTTGERDGVTTSNSANDHVASSSGNVQIDPLEPVKTLVNTSESHTSDDDVAIAEIVRYRLEVAIPEGVTNNFQITENLPAGLIYLDSDSSTNIAFVSNGTGISSSNSDINNITDINISGNAATAPDADAVLISSVIADEGSDGGFASGEDIIFSLGNLTNSDDDADNEYVVIEFNALVENISSNQAANAVLNNQFQVSATGSTTRTSNGLTLDIVEPNISDVAKAVDSATADAGDTLNYTVTFSNTGTATAFDVNITDNLPDELENLSITDVKINDATVTYTGGFTGNTLDITLDNSLAVNDNVEVTYSADVVSTVAPDTTFDNTANITYTSLDGTGTASNSTGSDNTTATSGDPDGERNGSGISPNSYTDSNDTAVTVTIASLDAVKTLESTSEVSTSGTDVIIGEILRYRLAVEIPEGESANFKITDALPVGITYSGNTKVAFVSTDSGASSGLYSDDAGIGSNPQIVGNAATTPTFDLPSSAIADAGADSIFDSGEDVIFSLGNLTNADDDIDSEFVVIEFDAIVDGVGSNGSLDNSFTVTAAIDDSISDTSGTVTVDVTLDYGDAPDSGSSTPSQGDYLTTETAGGASHGIRANLTIGSEIDADDGTLQNSAANADDDSNTGSTDDEDGVSSFALLETGASSYTVSVDVTNDTGEDATLVGWIDFNRNGDFESGEAVSTTVNSNSSLQTIDLTWDNNNGALPDIPNDITPGTTYARFRLSTDDDLDTDFDAGILDDGEVEDYQLTIYNTVTGNPYSDPITETDNVPDIITGGEGQDTITGGSGADIFVYTKTSDGVDIIEDFDDGEDLIDFSAIVTGELSGIDFTGTNPFDAGYVEAVSFGSHTMIQLDFDNSDSLQKDVLLLDGISATDITSADFIF
ncbi:MAG: isopeptide-forming domain-containing fimbrial protein [Cyanobacteria bacterium P01_F01_bin.143]